MGRGRNSGRRASTEDSTPPLVRMNFASLKTSRAGYEDPLGTTGSIRAMWRTFFRRLGYTSTYFAVTAVMVVALLAHKAPVTQESRRAESREAGAT